MALNIRNLASMSSITASMMKSALESPAVSVVVDIRVNAAALSVSESFPRAISRPGFLDGSSCACESLGYDIAENNLVAGASGDMSNAVPHRAGSDYAEGLYRFHELNFNCHCDGVSATKTQRRDAAF